MIFFFLQVFLSSDPSCKVITTPDRKTKKLGESSPLQGGLNANRKRPSMGSQLSRSFDSGLDKKDAQAKKKLRVLDIEEVKSIQLKQDQIIAEEEEEERMRRKKERTEAAEAKRQEREEKKMKRKEERDAKKKQKEEMKQEKEGKKKLHQNNISSHCLRLTWILSNFNSKAAG